MEEKKPARKNPYFGTEVRAPITPKHKETAPAPEPEPTVEPKPVEVEAPMVEKPEAATDLLANLKNKKPVGKGYNIYLDSDVIEKVDKLAKQAKTSRSKVLNTLLRNLLLDK